MHDSEFAQKSELGCPDSVLWRKIILKYRAKERDASKTRDVNVELRSALYLNWYSATCVITVNADAFGETYDF
jgi:hypothetical protein